MSLDLEGCRICGQNQHTHNLFITRLEADDQSEPLVLSTVFGYVTNISITEDDGLPTSVCYVCILRLSEAYELKRQAREYNVRLKKQFLGAKVNSVNSEYNSRMKDSVTTEDPLFEVVVGEETHNQSFLIDVDEFMFPEGLEDINEVQSIDENELLSWVHAGIEPLSKDPIREDSDQESENEFAARDGVELLTGERVNGLEIVPFLSSQKVKRPRKISHVCKVCDRIFHRKSCLIDHLRLHANVKLFQCDFCDKSFVQVGNYRSHLRIHTKERPYKCHLCKKTYNQSSALKVHIRSHNDERNFKCDECGKAFTTSSDRNKHKRTHDPSKHIKCNYCEHLFAQKVNMLAHQRRKHSDEISNNKRKHTHAIPNSKRKHTLAIPNSKRSTRQR